MKLSNLSVLIYLSVVGVLDGSLDTQHLPQCVLVAMLDLELLPCLPEIGGDSGIGHLRTMAVDGTSSIDLAQFCFHVRESEAHFFSLGITENFDGFL